MRKVDNLPPSCALVTKSGSLNFLEPSGPVQACNGTALPFTASALFRYMSIFSVISCVAYKFSSTGPIVGVC